MAHLLLVDDDDVLRRILGRLLSQTGHTVVEAEDGAGALAGAAREAFDAILLDVMMPDMDGYALTRRLRERPETQATPILLYTASLRGPDPALAQAAGADAYLMKTTNPVRLNAQIEAALAAAAPRRKQAHHD
ncbi:MAG: response regulator [Anaerolineales bacterium]|nr:response regulator [Anaerolineales bacterium]